MTTRHEKGAFEIAVNCRFRLQPRSGVQRYANEIVSRLERRVEAITPSWGQANGVGHLWEQLALPALTRGRLLWSPGNTGPLTKRNQVVTIHDLATLDHPEWFSPRFAAFYRWLLPKLLPKVEGLICVSEFTRSRLLALLPVKPGRVTVVRPGVSRFFTRPAEAHLQQQLSELSLDPGYLLCVAAFEPRKNYRRLLEAWSNIGHQMGSLLVLSGHTGRSHIFAPPGLKPDASVRQLGYVSDELLPALYAGAKAMIFPSLYEGFGMPPLEAMACGTPVIASDRPALRETLGDAAFYCDPEDSGSIATAIATVSSSVALRQELAGRGFERVRLFDWDRTAEQTWDVLASAARCRRLP